MMELITIIVPIYNVVDYLNKCMESIVGQTYTNLEILLIDDGSTDGSAELCDAWQIKDSRVVVIHKMNGGVSDARNVGLDNAKGEYIAWIDSDDFVTNDYIEHLYTLCKKYNSDISCCSCTIVYEDGSIHGKTTGKSQELAFSRKDAISEMLYGRYFSNAPWGKLCKKSLYDGIRYPKGKIFEDMFVTYKLIDICNKVVYSSEKKYNYLLRKSSIMGSVDPDKRLNVIEAEEEALIFIEKNYPEAMSAIRFKLLASSMACVVLFDDTEENKTKIEALWNNIKRNRLNVLVDPNTTIKYRILSFVALFGRKALSVFYKKYIKR